MNINSFTLYREYYDLITLLDEKEQAQLLLAITKYMFEDIEPDLNEKQMKIFNNLKRPLNKSKKQSERRTNQKPNENQKETKKEPSEQPNENTSNDVYVNVNGNNLESNKRVVGGKEKTFIKPTPEEIHQYCLERNNFVNYQQFYDFYESKDWMIGKNKMKDWKACVRTWENRVPKQETVPDWFNKELKNKPLSREEENELERTRDELLETIENM